MCFGGKADHILATANRCPLEEDNPVYTFYDLCWNKLPVTIHGHENRDVPRPEHLEEMIGNENMCAVYMPRCKSGAFEFQSKELENTGFLKVSDLKVRKC